MERGLEEALDALAAWPSGIAATLEAARQVAARVRPLHSISSGMQKMPQYEQVVPAAGNDADSQGDIEMEPLATQRESGVSEDEADSQSGLEAIASADELAEFLANAELLSGLPVGMSQNADGWPECRGALAERSGCG
jgi:RNA polymerase primary sigma factor